MSLYSAYLVLLYYICNYVPAPSPTRVELFMTFGPNIRQIAVGRPLAHHWRCYAKAHNVPGGYNRARRLKKNESHGHLRVQDVCVIQSE